MCVLSLKLGRALSFLIPLKVGIFDSVQATFNLLDQSAGPALGRAHASGMDVIVKVGAASPFFDSKTLVKLCHVASPV